MASPLVELAKTIFEKADEKALHVHDIAARIMALQPNISSDHETFSKKVASAINQNTKTKEPIFKTVKGDRGQNRKGYYTLKPVRQNLPKISESLTSIDALSQNYIGKAGEYAVASELMFWGFNATILPIDEGMDVIAAKNNNYYHLQVKSSLSTKNTNDFSFPLKKHVFGNNSTFKDFYVFVMRTFERNKWTTNYAIFPSHEIDKMIFDGTITDRDKLSVKITCEKDRYFIGKQKNDITWYINNFSLIR